MPKGKSLSLREKVQVLEHADKEKSGVRKLAVHFGVSKTQIADILKQKETIMKLWTENHNENVKKVIPSGNKLDAVLFEWFTKVRANNFPISGPLLQEKALEVAGALGIENFKASNGWLEKFRLRHNIVFKSVCGEAADVCKEGATEWIERLPVLLENFKPRDIYNADETGLFFRALPNKTLALKSEKCSGGKASKDRLTVLLGANMEGDFLRPLVIGKAENPRCFKGVSKDKLPITWKSNKKAWMTTEIMTEWLQNLDVKMGKEKRKILLFLDNAPCHPNLKLRNIKLIFFPPNTTSVLQPMDQGIIKNFKVLYRQFIVKNMLTKFDQGHSHTHVGKSITVLDAIFWIDRAIKNIKISTVCNCFVKSGFCNIELSPEVEDVTNVEQLNILLNDAGESVEYASIDSNLLTVDHEVDMDDIIKRTLNEGDDESESDDSEPEPVVEEMPIVSYAGALHQIEQLKKFCISKGNSEALSSLIDVQINFEKEFITKRNKQTKINDFFTPT